MNNRCINLIEQIDRDEAHAKAVERVQRSHDMLAAAVALCEEHRWTLVELGRGTINVRYTVMLNAYDAILFYPASNEVSVMKDRKVTRIPVTAELDLHGVLSLHEQGRLKP